jgi:glycosyltransferase involved in cell wall biosynthesis
MPEVWSSGYTSFPLPTKVGGLHERSFMTQTRETGKKVCLLSSVRLATEHRMLSKEGASLTRAGYRVTIVAPHPHDAELSGITIKAVHKFTSRFARIVRTTWFIYREALRQRGDVYHFHDTTLIPVGWLLKLHGKRVLYDVREDTPAVIHDTYWIPHWARPTVAWALDMAEKLSRRMLDGIVAATPHIGQRFPGSKTVVVQNFPLLDEAFPASCPYLERPPLVLYIGTIVASRGVLELIDAMDLLPETLQARLALGGEFEPSALEQQARQKPGWKRTDYAGWQNRWGMLDLLSRALVGVVPLLPTPNHMDSQPIKLFEYMLAGLPVVVSNLPRQGEIVKEAQCGLLVEPGQPQALAEAIQWLLEHPEEAQAMGKRGRQAVLQTYNWDSQAQLLLHLYRRVAGGWVPVRYG